MPPASSVLPRRHNKLLMLQRLRRLLSALLAWAGGAGSVRPYYPPRNFELPQLLASGSCADPVNYAATLPASGHAVKCNISSERERFGQGAEQSQCKLDRSLST